MRKAIAIVVLVVLAILVTTVPAIAAPKTSYCGKSVTLIGNVMFSNVEVPHYELLVSESTGTQNSYVLLGDYDFGKYLGKTVIVKGTLLKELNIWMKPAIQVRDIKLYYQSY